LCAEIVEQQEHVLAERAGDIRHCENGEMPRLVGGGGEGMAQIARIEE
jgi:hypothetical protein